MTPEQFIAKWQAADLKERAAAQSHFNDLRALLDEPKPTDADPKGEWYCFERGRHQDHRRRLGASPRFQTSAHAGRTLEKVPDTVSPFHAGRTLEKVPDTVSPF